LYFDPDHSGIALYSSDFAFYAAEQGHQVDVMTGYSFYPKWKKRKEDKGKLFSTEYKKDVRILRGYIYVPKQPTTLKRVLQEFTFLFSAAFNYLRSNKPDVIVAFTTPITIGYLSGLLKKMSGAKLVINVQDFQLEAASSLGMADKSTSFKILEKLEKKSYQSADLITSISQSMCKLLTENKKLPESKTYLWPNWIKLSDYKLDSALKGNFKKANGVKENEKIIAYAGNIGLKQGLEIFIDLANAYKDDENLKFFLIGEGAGSEQIKKYAANFNLKNLTFLSLLNQEQYLDFLNDLDVFFLSQKKTDFDVYFPSKLLGLMATGKLLLLCADKGSELYKTTSENGIGLVSDYGDIEALKYLLKKIIYDKEIADKVTSAAAKYVEKFDREYVLDDILQIIKKI
jgi:colanic acid biosynthesis glycosyl transferase WcaI